MKKVLIVFVMLATVCAAFAQQAEETVVELMNGSIVRGELTEVGDGQRLYIKTTDGSIIYFTSRAVKEIGNKPVAQTRNFRNRVTVYLRNGSIITGQLTELQESGEMKIETSNRSVVYFTDKSVKEIVQGDAPKTTPRISNQQTQIATTERATTPRATQQPVDRADAELLDAEPLAGAAFMPGYKGFFDIGYAMKMGDVSTSRFELSTSHGVQITPALFIGLGVGFSLYSDGVYKEPYVNADGTGVGHKDMLEGTVDTLNIKMAIPIFADMRYNLMTEGSLIPFIGLKAGYTIGIADKELPDTETLINRKETAMQSVGFFLNPSVGAKYKITPSIAMNLSLGYSIQMFDYSWKLATGNEIQTKKKNNGGISVKVGIEF